MQHENLHIIEELDFVLTHPDCNASVVDKFYNNCLFMYNEVPLYTIIDHMRRVKPKVLEDWSKLNNTVKQVLLTEFETVTEYEKVPDIKVAVEIEGVTPGKNGIYMIPWLSQLDEPLVSLIFKKRKLRVIDRMYGSLLVIGVSKVNSSLYHLFVKRGGK